MSLDHRIECLHTLKKIGYQTGTGIMVGSPGQTVDDLVRDLAFHPEVRTPDDRYRTFHPAPRHPLRPRTGRKRRTNAHPAVDSAADASRSTDPFDHRARHPLGRRPDAGYFGRCQRGDAQPFAAGRATKTYALRRQGLHFGAMRRPKCAGRSGRSRELMRASAAASAPEPGRSSRIALQRQQENMYQVRILQMCGGVHPPRRRSSRRWLTPRDNRANRPLIEAILQKARPTAKGSRHREAAVLLDCDTRGPEPAHDLRPGQSRSRRRSTADRIVMFAPLYLSNYCINGCVGTARTTVKNKTIAAPASSPRRRSAARSSPCRIWVTSVWRWRPARIRANNPIEYVLESNQDHLRRTSQERRHPPRQREYRRNHGRELPQAAAMRASAPTFFFRRLTTKKATKQLHPTVPKHDYAYHTEAMDRCDGRRHRRRRHRCTVRSEHLPVRFHWTAHARRAPRSPKKLII